MAQVVVPLSSVVLGYYWTYKGFTTTPKIRITKDTGLKSIRDEATEQNLREYKEYTMRETERILKRLDEENLKKGKKIG